MRNAGKGLWTISQVERGAGRRVTCSAEVLHRGRFTLLEFSYGNFIRVHRCLSAVKNYFSQLILISFSTALNSGSPVRSSQFLTLASAAAKQSA